MPKKPSIKNAPVQKTARGFHHVEFTDVYGEKCSIQQSSSACEARIWLGINDAGPQLMASDAIRLGVPTNETTGWVPFPVPKEVLMKTRMHLNREQVIELIDRLQTWVDTESF